MHDVLAHRLSLLATYAGALEYRPDAPPEQLARAAGVVRAGAHQALDELREVIGVLRDDSAAGVVRPQPGLSDLAELVAETCDAGTPVELTDRTSRSGELPAGLGRTAYRVGAGGADQRPQARARPAGPATARRTARRPAAGRADQPGRACADTAEPSLNGSGTGTGLIGLTERARLTGGQLDHGVTADGQFRLRARLPWPVGPPRPAEPAPSAEPAHPADPA